jgi:hypothetical protein
MTAPATGRLSESLTTPRNVAVAVESERESAAAAGMDCPRIAGAGKIVVSAKKHAAIVGKRAIR